MYSRRLHTSYSKLQVRRYWRVGTHMGHQPCEGDVELGDRGTTFGHSEGINQLKQGTYKLYISEDDSLCNVPQGSCTCTGGVGEPSHPRCTGVMPPRFHLITQSTDGIIYERRDLTGMGSLTGLLHEAAVSDPPLAFFWIDTSGVPQPEDLSALFEFVNVNPYTEWRWRALAAASIRNDSGDCPPSNGVDGATNELAQEDADSYYDNATELDCLRAFVEEQYVQLRITVLQAQSAMPCCLRSAGNGEIGGKVEGPGKHQQQQPRNLRANLFDACESGALTSVQALCFRIGVVTWRPQHAIEGWEYISHRLIRHLQDASGGEDIKPQNLLSTSLFALTMLDELYMAFLPDITVVNNEVDEIESMLPLVRQRPSDQADVLRRVQLLRRNLSVHRRILMSKVTVLELLNRPTVRVLLSFMNTSTTSKLDTVVRYASSYVDIARHILPTLFKLDNARRVLTNSIIIYSSGASATNNCNSNKSDTLNVTLGYVALISIPPTIVASQWALEFHVPWRAGDSTTQFWAMVGVMGACMLMVLVYPVYCWIRGRPDKFVFH
ncbi:CorA-like Mg2+ transporter protein [Trypanosoma brucei equiperdum]|uniref:CorA-like Mg2+ transporter protein n=1 Tax=Trypanosoma brucei equiperdum TaxID=630700 RepID=A0A3L6L8D2_9TRYP|nr:CorA-like Mg2+ transporter protein [Trypanosoma brucei equiperdum]